MVKNELEFSIRPVDKIDWLRFELSSGDGSSDDPQYQNALNTLRGCSKIDIENPGVERCYIAESNSSILGYIYGFVLPNKLLIPEFVYVRPIYRRKGIAKSLFIVLEKESKCYTSMIFYHKTMREHYRKIGYIVGENLEVAMKELKPANKKSSPKADLTGEKFSGRR